MEFPAEKVDAADAAATASVGDCKPTDVSATTYVDGSQVTFYQLPPVSDGGDFEVWAAQYQDRLALAVMGGTTSAPPADVVARVSDLLLGGLRVDSTFTSVSDGTVTSSGSASTSPVTSVYATVSERDFAQALGTWPNGWQERGTKESGEPLPCAGDWASSSSGAYGASLGSNGEQDVYAFGTSADATAAAAALAADLQACPSSPATVSQVPGTGTAPPVTVVAGSGDSARVTWITQHGAKVSYITVPGSTSPPDNVSLTVAGLMIDAMDKVTESGPPPVESSTPVQQGGSSTSSSSSSAAAPKN
jgi:hypothetical protein